MAGDFLTADDGTVFTLQSEHVRGEPRAYWVMRRDVGARAFVHDFEYDESTDRRTAERRLKKRVADWNSELAKGYTRLKGAT